MRYIVLKNFSGVVSAVAGTVIDLDDRPIADDLINAGYIEAIDKEEEPKAEPKPKTVKKKGGKAK